VTIVIGRFIPIIRTFAPFLAGVAGMSYRRFLAFNVIGGVLWVASLVYAGYLFGNIPWVKNNLTLIVIGIVVVSLLPALMTFVRERGVSTGSRVARVRFDQAQTTCNRNSPTFAGDNSTRFASSAASPMYVAGVNAFSRAFASDGTGSPSMNVCNDSRVMPVLPRVSDFNCS